MILKIPLSVTRVLSEKGIEERGERRMKCTCKTGGHVSSDDISDRDFQFHLYGVGTHVEKWMELTWRKAFDDIIINCSPIAQLQTYSDCFCGSKNS